MINVKNLTKTLPQGEVLFSGIDLSIAQGELAVVLGPSGSGKSTLLRCIYMREKWNAGKMLYKDQDVMKMGWFKKRRILKEWCFIEEQPVLKQDQTVIKNVLSGSRRHRSWWRRLIGKISKEEHTYAMDCLHKVGLMNKELVQVGKLSGGEMQRIALARALAQQAKVIVADNPVANVDPHTAHSIMAVIQTLCQSDGCTFICTLPQFELAEKYASHLIGLRATGRHLTEEEKMLLT